MAAFNADGKVVAVNDQVTIMGSVDTITGTGGGATVTVIPLAATASISALARDMYAAGLISGAAQSATGKPFGVGDRVSVMGVVTAVSGSGAFASLTVKINSGTSVTVPAMSVRSTTNS